LEHNQKAIKPTLLLKGTPFRRFVYHNSYLLVAAAWLVTLSFIFDNYWSVNASVKGVRKNIDKKLHRQERDFEALVADTAAINRLAQKKYDAAQLAPYWAKDYFFFIYPALEPWQQSVLFWNTHTVQPDSSTINNGGKCGFALLSNGYYVWRRQVVGNYLCVALMPMKWKYYVNNAYLVDEFVVDKGIAQHYAISDTAGAEVVQALDGSKLFYLYEKDELVQQQATNSLPAVWMRILAVLCLLLFLHLLANYLSQHHGALMACIFLITTALVLRVLSYFFPLPLNMRQFELFDPSIYGGGEVLRSLGDLLINAGLFVWLVLFVRQQVFEKLRPVTPATISIKAVLLLAGALLLVLATLIGGHMVGSLVADSQISFDVVDFTSLNSYSVAGFLGLCCIGIGYFLFAQVVLFFIRPLFDNKIIYVHLTVAFAGLLALTLRIGNGHIEFELCQMIWLQLFLLLFNQRLVAMPDGRLASSKLVFWLLFFSASVTAIIVMENAGKELANRKRYAINLSNMANSRNERVMNTMLTDFNNTFLSAQFGRLADSVSNRRIKDSLIKGNISIYHNKFKTAIYTFDSLERPLFNTPDTATFSTLSTIVSTSQAKHTGIPDLYTYDVSFDQFNYLFKKEVKDTANRLLGYVFIVVTPSTHEAGGLTPELFSNGDTKSLDNSPVYSYAVYDHLQLVARHNDHNFFTTLREADTSSKELFYMQHRKGYNELRYKPSADKMVIIVRKGDFFITAITLFSYLFCAFLLVTAFFWLLNAFIRSRFNRQRWKEYWQLTIRSQVHATVIFISVLSFLVIGLATVFFFKNRYENNKRMVLSSSMQLVEREIRKSLDKIVAFDDVIEVGNVLNRPRLDSIIQRMTEIHGIDINLYNMRGDLEFTSNPLVYSKGVISKKMHPEAYFQLHEQKAAQFFNTESIGNRAYMSNYVPVTDDRGKSYAYLNVPYFKSESELKQEISSFFVAIINLNAFIFLIAGVVALFIANRITRSFSFISEKMREVNLGKMNEAIEWKRNDEIGNLVNEYNKMVAKLDDSAAALAKSEREGAWREMARQVAHEIKNPLTPMKLSLQYLQKAIKSNAPNVQELSANVSQTLVEQIDHLSQIASEFSQFANIGNPKKEWFDLNEVLRLVIQLHTMGNLQLNWQLWQEPVMMYADRTHFNRLFTNLLLNAIQSVPPDRHPIIAVRNYVSEQTVTIEVSDNGSGIPEDMQGRIFTPNFTTKTSGTGLGLAMCKGIVEQARGRIWFETIPGKGTVFYVALPLGVESE
jgi:two-component system, NtrC family, nitrogen regulation sensor histidine kinase NtrY